MDDALSQAIREAYASAPSSDIIYHTLELVNDAFSTPIRVVQNEENISAVLEATAPENPGEEVLFLAFQFDFSRPEVLPNSVPQCTIEIANVGREVLAQIEAAVAAGTVQSTKVIYREYLENNLAVGPENDPPLELTLLSVTADVFRIRATAGFPNLANRRFPNMEYTAEVFPGLVPQS